MLFGENYRQRALELYRENTAQEVFRILIKEYPDKSHPTERTLGRWKKIRKKQRTICEAQAATMSEFEHRVHMTKIAEMLLDNDIGRVVIVGGGEQPESVYSIVSPESDYYEIKHNELVGRIEHNIDCVCREYNPWYMFNCFAEHLMAEFPPALDYYELLNKHPGKLINALRTMAERKTFKGTCPVCEDYHNTTGGL